MGQWTTINSGTTENLVYITFPDSLNGYIVGGSQGATILLKTSDGGHSWNQILNYPNNCYRIDFINQDTGVFFCDSILKTFDGGINWTPNPIGPIFGSLEYGWPFFHMYTANDWFIMNDWHVDITNDGGNTWQYSQTNCIMPSDMQIINDSTVIGCGLYNSEVFKTIDRGYNWITLSDGNSPPHRCPVKSIAFISETVGYGTGDSQEVDGGGFMKTTDGGVSWHHIFPDTTAQFGYIRHIDENTLYAVGDSGTIVKTNDAGVSWSNDTSGSTMQLNEIIFLNDKAIVVGDSGTILMNTNVSAVTGLKENIKSSQDVNAFPNPFNNFTTIKFNNPDHKKHLLTIFDLSGKTSRQINNITTEEIMINRGDLPGGAYFFQLENDTEIIGNGKLLIE